ncbi:hypothetical protein COLO4_24268 [Corchorus olitorius]|uniref:Uncharacterized protein n=1 Tax=Corchorus olitorius TaxID=93759 RepID=A0A1R3IBS0_9ROSI|nr:hypothetical protein COLO4_24268 [Corchorus olitorius]
MGRMILWYDRLLEDTINQSEDSTIVNPDEVWNVAVARSRGRVLGLGNSVRSSRNPYKPRFGHSQSDSHLQQEVNDLKAKLARSNDMYDELRVETNAFKSSLLAALQLRGIDLFDETGEIAHADEHSPVPKKARAASTSIGNDGPNWQSLIATLDRLNGGIQSCLKLKAKHLFTDDKDREYNFVCRWISVMTPSKAEFPYKPSLNNLVSWPIPSVMNPLIMLKLKSSTCNRDKFPKDIESKLDKSLCERSSSSKFPRDPKESDSRSNFKFVSNHRESGKIPTGQAISLDQTPKDCSDMHTHPDQDKSDLKDFQGGEGPFRKSLPKRSQDTSNFQ